MSKSEKTIDIEERNDATLIIAGTDKEYRLPIRTFWVVATELELQTSYKNTEPKPFILGKCKFLKRDTISVIGYEGLNSKEMELSIRSVDHSDFDEINYRTLSR